MFILLKLAAPDFVFLEPLITILEPGNKPYIYGKVTAEKKWKKNCSAAFS